ncbi:uncharacterized protein LMH87_008322 [Akanthomyces muscarius]|uniref:Uncharacterized protein n=1 Tax=Akanthomyces muscarius TaxID=2231603 RepID=A0A9W8UQW6_AKAMU|nr:uncharacterized protein LMH87_008322 [Akanthomyces muscarius]KAJ4159420.1 hypothetical protein LMH87_008322 [Akanthomyces muscarius]
MLGEVAVGAGMTLGRNESNSRIEGRTSQHDLLCSIADGTGVRVADGFNLNLNPNLRSSPRLARQQSMTGTSNLRDGKEAAAAAAAGNSSAPEPEMVGVPTLAELESKSEEYDKIMQAASSDWTISNAKKREMSIERVTLRSELVAARREALAIKQQEEWAKEEQANANADAGAHSR